MLDRMATFNVRLKASKFSFGMISVEFFERFVQRNIPILTSVSAVGIVNNFRNFPSLSSYLQQLIRLTKKQNFGENGFEMTENALSAFQTLKNQVIMHTSRFPVIPSLYTDASKRGRGGVLMQIHGGSEKPCVFVSHTLSEKAMKWRVMEQELSAFVF